MKILAFFTNNGVPQTGLDPTVRIRNISDNTLIVTDSTSSEVGDGWYKYNFTSYDGTKEYGIRFDGGPTLTNQERYTFGVNDNFYDDIGDSVLDELIYEHSNNGSLGNTISTLNTDMKRVLGLIHENIYIDNTTYDNNKNLVSARVRLYSDAESVGTNSNVIGIYSMIMQGNGVGKFTNWKQTKV